LLSQRALRDHVSEVLKVAFENGIRYQADFTSNAEPASSAGIPVYPDAVRFTGDGALSLPGNETDAVILPGGPPWPVFRPEAGDRSRPGDGAAPAGSRPPAHPVTGRAWPGRESRETGPAPLAAGAWPAAEPAAAGRRGRHAASRPGLPLGLVAVISAAGLLLVALAYTSGRLGQSASPWADRLYWLGQGLILVPVAGKLLGRRVLGAGETVILVVTVAVTEYLAWICYSPSSFTFPDELEHVRGTVNVLQTGGLSAVNYLLPISPHYPGLEEVTSALASVTGLSVFTSGLIIAGVAHLLFVLVLFLLFREVSGSHRVAGVAMLCYASSSHFTSFDSMFIYQTLALPFLGLTLLATWRLASRPAAEPGWGWLAVAVAAIGTTVVTHHVTSYVLVAALALVTGAALLVRNWRTAAWAAVLALLSGAATAAWLAFAAPQTWDYLQPFAAETLQSLQALLSGGHASVVPVSAGPLTDRALSDAAVLAVSVLLPIGWWQVWRRHRQQPWAVAMAIGSAGWYATVAIRLLAADSSELAGRSATFVFVPAAYIAALAVGRLAGAAVRRHARAASAAMLVVVLTLMFNGLANGWPPYWERLPGAYQVAGAERAVEPEVIAAAGWTLAELGPGHRFATDIGSYPVLGSYGDQNPVRDVAYLYTSPRYTQADASRSSQQALRYVWVDQRLSTSLPASGQYFPVDPDAGKYEHPLSPADVGKFNRVPGVDRIYDSGHIVIYQLPGAGR
jgi:hypothetical protein